MRQLLNGEWEPLDELLANIDSDGMPRQELIDKVAFVTATELSSNRRKYGAEAIVDFLEWTEFIESNEDDIYTVVETPNEEDSDESNQNEEQETPSDDIDSLDSEDNKYREEPAKGTNSEKAAPPSEGPDSIDATDIQVTDGVNLNIDLELSGNENPENVRKLILAIRKASDQDIGEYEFPESPD